LIASPDGRGESVSIHQDVFVYATVVDGDKPLVHGLEPHRCAYVHVVKGELTVSGQRLGGGDAIKLSDADRVVIENGRGAEVVLFDLPLQKERMPSAHPMSGAQQLA
jgi:redox-sensitive bicupin YhaK (pirin superfamily)